VYLYYGTNLIHEMHIVFNDNYAFILEYSHRRKRVDRVTGKTADGLRENEVNNAIHHVLGLLIKTISEYPLLEF
jgi:hypothetical protein